MAAFMVTLTIVALVCVLYALLRVVLLVFFLRCLGGRTGNNEHEDFDSEA